MKVPWLPKDEIADLTADVIAGYEDMVGHPVSPPVPVELIIEQYLDLQLDYVDFEEKYGEKGILGATYVKRRVIAIDENLSKARSEGRICWTYAHEAGHWCLHRHLVDTATRSSQEAEIIFCRAQDAKAPIEWQADYFAGCLLMPENDVREAFGGGFNSECLDLYNVRKNFVSSPFYFDPCVENWHLIAGKVIDLGNFTNVSKQAMIIKLQELGLVNNKTNVRADWRVTSLRVN